MVQIIDVTPGCGSKGVRSRMRKFNRSLSLIAAMGLVAVVWIGSNLLPLTGHDGYLHLLPEKANKYPNRPIANGVRNNDSSVLKSGIDAPDEPSSQDQINLRSFTKVANAFKNLEHKIPSFDYESVQKRLSSLKLQLDDVRHDKWIIITSIALPTEDVKYLAGLQDWTVLIVADSVTPTNWSYPNCVFLSVAKQLQMGSSLVPIVPYGIYGRKTVGYIYAIAHGAQLIYETDDDNRPLDDLKSYVFTERMTGLMYAGRRLFNPYRHYGQSTLWPRGYPLSMVGADSSNDYRLSSDWKTPAIQQGVVNGDPDMDAIFRLTRKLVNKRLDVIFDPAGPPAILPEGVFSPYNAQNTVFHKSAFWGLYLPQVPTFRVTDIWRSYWNQRLLWEIGERFGYFPPNAYQLRNPHSYLEDFEKEEQLYSSTEALLDFLYFWTCPETDSFFQCVYRLSLDMAAKDFWKDIDAEGVKRWLEDLVRMGYPEPKRVPWNSTTASSNNQVWKQIAASSKNQDSSSNLQLEARREETLSKGTYVHFVPAEQVPPTINRHGPSRPNSLFKQVETIVTICPQVDSLSLLTSSVSRKVRGHFEDILLVVVLNSPYDKNVRVLEVTYRSIFPNIAYCGWEEDSFFNFIRNSSLKDNVSFLEIPDLKDGYLAYKCAAKTMAMNLNVTGYLFTAEDHVVNFWQFYQYDKDRVWASTQINRFKADGKVTWAWWYKDTGKKAYKSAWDALRQGTGSDPPEGVVLSAKQFLHTLSSSIGEFPNAAHAASDVYYIPSRLRRDAAFYFEFFASHNVMDQLAVPMVLRGIEDASLFQRIPEMNWDKLERIDLRKNREKRTTSVDQPPAKFSSASIIIDELCSSYLQLLKSGKNATASLPNAQDKSVLKLNF